MNHSTIKAAVNRSPFLYFLVLHLLVLGLLAATFFSIALSPISLSTLAKAQDSKIDTSALSSIPYASLTPVKAGDKKELVTKHLKGLAQDGLNLSLWNFGNKIQVPTLVDMDGTVVKKWPSYHVKAARETTTQRVTNRVKLQHVELLKNGDLIRLAKYGPISRVNSSGKVLWQKNLIAHHDVQEAENGDLYVLGAKLSIMVLKRRRYPVVSSFLFILSADGEVKRQINLDRLLKPFISKSSSNTKRLIKWFSREKKIRPRKFRRLLRVAEKGGMKRFAYPENSPADWMHINTIEFLSSGIPGIAKKGDLLLAARNLDLIFVMKQDGSKLLWSFGPGEIIRPHFPRQLENGNILIFDNHNGSKRRSRVIELDPTSKTITWEYPPRLSRRKFYTHWGGSAQRLANGNTLITSSQEGRSIEVTQSGKIVWEYFAPIQQVNSRKVRTTLYRMERYDRKWIESVMKLN